MYSSYGNGAARQRPPPAPKNNRDSAGGVRMSVLDVAMEIGLGGGNNSLQDWIYNNQLAEEEEEFEPPKSIPELTKEPSESSHGSSPKTPSVTDISSTLSGSAFLPARSTKSTTPLVSPVIFKPSTTVDPDNYHNSFFPAPPPEFNAQALGPKIPQGKPILSKRPSKPAIKPSHVSIPSASFSSMPSLQLTMPSGTPAPRLETPFSGEHDKPTFVVPFEEITTSPTGPPDSPVSPPLHQSTFSSSSHQSSKATLPPSSLANSASRLSVPEKHHSLEKKKSRWSRKSSKEKGAETDYETDGYISEGATSKSHDKAARKSTKLVKKSKSIANMHHADDIDDGYLSSKSSKSVKAVSAPSTPQKSSGFFWRRKSKKDEWEGAVPPMPSVTAPKRPTPIASRFGSTPDVKNSVDSQETSPAKNGASSTSPPPRRRHQSPKSDPDDQSHRHSQPMSEPSSRSSFVSDERPATSPRFARQAPPVLRMKPLNITKRSDPASPPKGRSNISLPVTRPTETGLVSDLVSTLESLPVPARPRNLSGSASPSSFKSITPTVSDSESGKALQSNASTPRKAKKEKRTSFLGMMISPSKSTSPPPPGPLPATPSLGLNTTVPSLPGPSSAPGSYTSPVTADNKPKHESAKASIGGTAMYREITVFGDVVREGVVVNRASEYGDEDIDPLASSPASGSIKSNPDADSLSMYDPAAGLDGGPVSPNIDAIEFVKAAAGQYGLPSEKWPSDRFSAPLSVTQSEDSYQTPEPQPTNRSYFEDHIPPLAKPVKPDEPEAIKRNYFADHIPPLAKPEKRDEPETLKRDYVADHSPPLSKSPPRDHFQKTVPTVAAKRDYFEKTMAAVNGNGTVKRDYFKDPLPPPAQTSLPPVPTAKRNIFEAPEHQKYDDDEVSPDADMSPTADSRESAEGSDRPVIYPTEYLEDDDDDRSIYPPSARSPTGTTFTASFFSSPTESTFPSTVHHAREENTTSNNRSQRNVRTTMYSTYTYEDGDPRFSRYSAAESEYSVLDAERSGEVRDRLIRRVEAIQSRNGVSVGARVVPPVPRLPEEYSKKRF